jgi:hypothetical protein
MTLLVGGGVGMSGRVLGFSPAEFATLVKSPGRKTGRRIRPDTPTPPFISEI